MTTDAARVQAETLGAPSARLPREVLRAIAAWTLAALVLYLAYRIDAQFARFWAFGLAFGFVLQRGRFCFASAFRDLFLLGRPLRAHVVGRNAGHALNHQLVVAIQKAVAADRRRTATRTVRPAVPAAVGGSGDGFLPGIAAL